MKISGIYGIHNIVNQKWYIGQSQDCIGRWYWHLHLLGRNQHFNSHLQAAYNKYGKSSFEFIQIERVSGLLRNKYECLWVAQLQSDNPQFGYNKTSGGCKNMRLNAETKHKISINVLRKNVIPEVREKLSTALKRYYNTPEGRDKQSKRMLTAWASPEFYHKMSKIRKGIKQSKQAIDNRAEILRRVWTCPELRSKMSITVHKALTAPGMHAKLSESTKRGRAIGKQRRIALGIPLRCMTKQTIGA